MHNNPEHSKMGRRAAVDTSICAPSPRLLNSVEVHCYSVVRLCGSFYIPWCQDLTFHQAISILSPELCDEKFLFGATVIGWRLQTITQQVQAPQLGPRVGKKRQSVQCMWQFNTVTQSLKDERSTPLGVMLALELPFPAPGQNGNGVFVGNWGHSCNMRG